MNVCIYSEAHLCVCMRALVCVISARGSGRGPTSLRRIIDLHEFVSWAHKRDRAIRSTLCWKEERSPRPSLCSVKMSLSIRLLFTGCYCHGEKKVCQLSAGGQWRGETAQAQTRLRTVCWKYIGQWQRKNRGGSMIKFNLTAPMLELRTRHLIDNQVDYMRALCWIRSSCDTWTYHKNRL